MESEFMNEIKQMEDITRYKTDDKLEISTPMEYSLHSSSFTAILWITGRRMN